jgi:hypothetical protein
MVVAKQEEITKLNENAQLKKRFENKKLYHAKLDFCLPHEFGGLGDPID